jgi:hypothetical protein
LKLDQLLKTAVGGGAGSEGGVTGKLKASGPPPVPLSFGVTGSCSLSMRTPRCGAGWASSAVQKRIPQCILIGYMFMTECSS